VRLPRDKFLLAAIDLALVAAALWLAFWLRFNLEIPDEFIDMAWAATPWCVLAYAVGLGAAQVYRQVWSYIGLPELRQLAMGIVVGDRAGRPAGPHAGAAGRARACPSCSSGQTVLVTGAGGSIGSELCRQIARFGVARLVCVDVSEYATYQLEQELREAHPQMQGCTTPPTCASRAPARHRPAKHRPSVVLHAAAYKHVPLMESLNEIEALRTNVLGTLNAARVAGEWGLRASC
jgi:FlaA1/EpsC-like NDP-sugar epimerase